MSDNDPLGGSEEPTRLTSETLRTALKRLNLLRINPLEQQKPALLVTPTVYRKLEALSAERGISIEYAYWILAGAME